MEDLVGRMMYMVGIERISKTDFHLRTGELVAARTTQYKAGWLINCSR